MPINQTRYSPMKKPNKEFWRAIKFGLFSISAGLIEIGKNTTGEIMTTFKLEHGADWIARQDIIQFKVYNPENLIPDTSTEQN